MLLARPLLVVVAAAAAVAPPSGCRPLEARLVLARLEGGKPEHALARCLADGGRAPITYSWKLGAGLRQDGYNAPADEPTIWIAIADPARAGDLHCTAVDATGAGVTAAGSLSPLAITKVAAPANAPITVEGSGFGARGPDDAIYYVPMHGEPVRADHACKPALWSDTKIVACAPKLDPRAGVWEVRVASAGRLAVAPP